MLGGALGYLKSQIGDFAFSHQDEIYGLKSPERFLDISFQQSHSLLSITSFRINAISLFAFAWLNDFKSVIYSLTETPSDNRWWQDEMRWCWKRRRQHNKIWMHQKRRRQLLDIDTNQW